MKIGGTAVVGAFATALALYTAWEYRKAQDSIGSSPEEKKLFSLVKEQIDKIKISHPAAILELEKKDGEWQILQPVQDQAEETAVEALLYSLTIQHGKNFRTDDSSKTTNLAEFGLDKPGSVVEITGNGKTETLNVSNKNAFDGSYYISQGGEVLLGDRGLAQVVAKDVKHLRSRHVWCVGDADIESATVELNLDGAKDKYSIKKVDGVLTVDPKPKFAVDPEKVRKWVGNLQTVTAVELSVDQPNAEDKRNFLLVKPSFIAKFHFKRKDGSEGDWSFTVGQDKAEDVYAVASTRDTVYKYSRNGLKDVRVSREYFREGKAPFKFPIEQATQVDLRQGEMNYKFKKDGAEWKLEGDGKDLKFDADKLVKLMQSLSNIEAAEFFPMKDLKGVKDSERLAVRDGKGAVLFEMSWGDEYQARQPYNKPLSLRMVKTNLSSDGMGIDAFKFKSLVDPALVTKKESK